MTPLQLPLRNIRLLTLDAFGTIFHPKQPIAQQYLAEARRFGLHGLSEEGIALGFREAFRVESRKYPNYGKAVGMGAEEWWLNVITSTFRPLLPPSTLLPPPLIRALLTRFSTSHGYALYPDIPRFLQRLLHQPHISTPKTRPIIGVVSNSDDRVPGILSSLGLRVGSLRYGMGIIENNKNTTDGGGGDSPKKNHNPNSDIDIDITNDIDFLILSYDVNASKPHRAIFDAARCMAGVGVGEWKGEGGVGEWKTSDGDGWGECVHVGDDLEKDYRGAKRAGWRGVWLDRCGEGVVNEGGERTNKTETESITRITSLDDLVFY